MNNNIYTQFSDLPFPSSKDIERQVLTDAANDYECLPELMQIVKDEMFTDGERLQVWQTICELYNGGKVVDLPSIGTRCGQALINEVVRHHLPPSTPAVAVEHAVALREVSIHRRAYTAAVQLVTESCDLTRSSSDLFASVEELRTKVVGDADAVGEEHIAKVVADIADEVEERENGKRKAKIPTGFEFLDWRTYQGWDAGQLIILAARPSVGKTAVMLKMARAAAQAGNKVCIYSMEMTNAELGTRMLFATEKVKPKEIATGEVDWNSFTQAQGEVSALPIIFNDFSSTLSDIVSRIIMNNKSGKCDIAFIDYLGRFQEALDNKVPLYQAIGKITGRLKSLAKRLRIPIVLLCQLNRESVKGERAPELYDLRDSGSIEQDADIVMMLERNDDETLTIWLRKNRQGKRDEGAVLRHNDTYSDFYETGDIKQ